MEKEELPRETRRAWFQIHLSTDIVLTFVAGGLLWLNCGRHSSYIADYTIMGDRYEAVVKSYRVIGWPIAVTKIDAMKIDFFYCRFQTGCRSWARISAV